MLIKHLQYLFTEKCFLVGSFSWIKYFSTLLIYTVLQLSTLGDKQFENPQTGNLSKIMKDSVLVKECLLDLNKPRTEQTEGSTEKKKKGFVCDHFLLYVVVFNNFKNDMVLGCPLS